MPEDDDLSSSDTSQEQEPLDSEDDDEVENITVVSLLDSRTFPDAVSMISYCKEQHNFDFLGIRDRLRLDFLGTVKLVNFIRERIRSNETLPKEIQLSDLEGELYLKPVLEDDALLFCLDDLPASNATHGQPEESSKQHGITAAAAAPDLVARNASLEAELEALTKQFKNYQLAVQETLDRRWGVENGEIPDEGPSASQDASGNAGHAVKDDSQYYWESYAHNDIHEIMLKDTVRTDAYRDFIYDNKHLFAGKVVLDIGCGTGILSMFCARAGAARVVAVDKSDIIDKARENIFHNNLGDKITTLKGRIEDVVLPVKQVDIIVSEWMGYCLLYEAMLPSVIWARDRYLAPDGLLVPSHASMWIAPISDSEFVNEHVTFWSDVYGFDMKAMQEGIYADARVQILPEASLSGLPYAFGFLDLHKTRAEDLVFDVPWHSKVALDAESLDGFLVWFDIFFTPSRNDTTVSAQMTAKEWAAEGQQRVSFTTGPHGKETHWRHCILLNKNHSLPQQAGVGQDIHGTISYSAPENHARGLNIRVTWEIPSNAKQSQMWLLN